MSNILVIAPHPDDETLGCGGTLMKHRDQGDDINWLIISSTLNNKNFASDYLKKRAKEIEKVTEAYSFNAVYQLNFETTRLDTIPLADLIKEISSIMEKVKADILYLPFRNDSHSDHKVVFDSVVALTKSFRNPNVRKIRVYETLSETELDMRPVDGGFRPNLFVDISKYLERKIDVMKLYEGEMKEHPFPRSEQNIRALATFRGSIAGCYYAEAFMSLKEIWK